MSTITASAERPNTYRSLKDKVILITGAATGIGRAIAIETARQGANVVVNYIGEPEAAQEVVREIENDHGEALAIRADVSKSDQVQRMISQIVSQFGRVDVLVNNAGIEKESPFLEKPESEFDAVIGVNLKGPFLCTQAAARDMAKRKKGTIINISSVHEVLPFPGY